MFIIRLFRTNEGDLPYPDARLEVSLDEAKAITVTRLEGAFRREGLGPQKPTMARVYAVSEVGPDELVAAFRCGPLGVTEMRVGERGQLN